MGVGNERHIGKLHRRETDGVLLVKLWNPRGARM